MRLAHAEQVFLNVVETLKIPVVVSKLGQDLIDYQHPYYVGFGGTKGTRPGNFAMQNADLILAIGSRLAIPFTGYEYELFGREAKKIAVDIDSDELRKNTIKLDVAIQADAKLFLETLLKEVQNNPLPEQTRLGKKMSALEMPGLPQLHLKYQAKTPPFAHIISSINYPISSIKMQLLSPMPERYIVLYPGA